MYNRVLLFILSVYKDQEWKLNLTRASTDCVKLSLFVQKAAQKPPFLLHCVAGVIRKDIVCEIHRDTKDRY